MMQPDALATRRPALRRRNRWPRPAPPGAPRAALPDLRHYERRRHVPVGRTERRDCALSARSGSITNCERHLAIGERRAPNRIVREGCSLALLEGADCPVLGGAEVLGHGQVVDGWAGRPGLGSPGRPAGLCRCLRHLESSAHLSALTARQADGVSFKGARCQVSPLTVPPQIRSAVTAGPVRGRAGAAGCGLRSWRGWL